MNLVKTRIYVIVVYKMLKLDKTMILSNKIQEVKIFKK